MERREFGYEECPVICFYNNQMHYRMFYKNCAFIFRLATLSLCVIQCERSFHRWSLNSVSHSLFIVKSFQIACHFFDVTLVYLWHTNCLALPAPVPCEEVAIFHLLKKNLVTTESEEVLRTQRWIFGLAFCRPTGPVEVATLTPTPSWMCPQRILRGASCHFDNLLVLFLGYYHVYLISSIITPQLLSCY